MARYTGPKCKLCRREGEKLFLRGERCLSPKCALERRPFPPGQHGLRQKGRKMSIYGLQLREKQKLKRMYGVLEAQFRRYVEKAKRMPGNTGENLLSLLERRLDNVVYRIGLAKSRAHARQLVRHGHIRVDGRKVDIPSYLVRRGQEIRLDPSMADNPEVQGAIAMRAPTGVPAWLKLHEDRLGAEVVNLPTRMDITYPIDERLIIEFYSR